LIKDLNETERDEFILQLELRSYTKSSIVKIDELKKSMEKILAEGYCHTRSEHLNGVVGISVPVFNFQKTNVAAVLSVFMPDSHFDENDLEKYVISLKNGANEIGKSIP
jgi:IclR family transcriptional regulator, KDG regulon repressor